MKKAISVLLIITLALFMAVPVFAVPEGTVGKFSPALDGAKDEAYDQSFSFGIFDQEEAIQGEGWYSTSGETVTSMDAKIYYLWDDKYLYAFVEITSNEVMDAGKDLIMESDNPWESDCVELWFLWDDLDDNINRMKISAEPFHGKEWGDGPFYEEVAPNSKRMAVISDKGYNAEFQIAIPAEYLKDGGQIKATLQVNDFNADGTIAVGQQIGNTDNSAVLTLGAPIVIAEPEPEPEPEPDPVVDDTAMGGGEENVHVEAVQEPAPAPTVPETGDASVVAILGLFVAAGLAVSVLKKKKI